MTRKSGIVLALVLVLALIGCAPANKNLSLPVGEEISLGRTSFSFDKEQGSYDLFPQYQLKPGDLLDVLFQIRTWAEKESFTLAVDHTVSVKFDRASELNEEQRVRPDGTISLPYIGSVYVIGKTVPQLEAELKAKYDKILRKPELHIVVPEFRSSIKELKADLHTAPRGLSRLVTVRPDGYVTFPMVGDTYVAGKTISEVNTELNRGYEKIIPDLHCDLFLEQHSGSVVYVVGEVKKPGSYPIAKPIAVLQAISIAGSTTDNAELAGVMVVRKKGDGLVATRVDLNQTLDFAAKTPFFFLQPDDIVVVPKTRIAESAQLARYIGDILFFRGWDIQLNTGNIHFQ